MPAWTCGRCTFVNHELMDLCEMCEGQKSQCELRHKDKQQPPLDVMDDTFGATAAAASDVIATPATFSDVPHTQGPPSGYDAEQTYPLSGYRPPEVVNKVPEDILTGGHIAIGPTNTETTTVSQNAEAETSVIGMQCVATLPEPMTPTVVNGTAVTEREESPMSHPEDVAVSPMSEPEHIDAAMCMNSLEKGLTDNGVPNGWSFLDKEIRIVLIGKTGVGKSSTGNNILNSKDFKSSASGTSITRKCQLAWGNRFDREIQIIDTPGLFDTNLTNEQITREVVKCIGMTSPGPHAFVLIIRLDRFTEEEKTTVQHFINIFGKEMLQYLIVLFTRKDDLKYEGITVKEYVQNVPPDLKELLQACQHRYLAIDNRGTQAERDQDVKDLLDMVDTTVKSNGGGHYTNEMYEQVERLIAEQEEVQLKTSREKMQSELNRLREEVELELRRKDEEKERNLESMKGVMTELGMGERDDGWVQVMGSASLTPLVEHDEMKSSLKPVASPGPGVMAAGGYVPSMNGSMTVNTSASPPELKSNTFHSFGAVGSTDIEVGGPVDVKPSGPVAGQGGSFHEPGATAFAASAQHAREMAWSDSVSLRREETAAADRRENDRLIGEANKLRFSVEKIEMDKVAMRQKYIMQQEAALEAFKIKQQTRRQEMRREMADTNSGIFTRVFGFMKKMWKSITAPIEKGIQSIMLSGNNGPMV